MLKDLVNENLIKAMKARDDVTLRTLRMLKSAIMKYEVSFKDAVANDEVVMDLLQKEAKSRKDSIEQFRRGNREDLAGAEEAELLVLQSYLPQQLEEEELRAIVAETIVASGAKTPAEIGKVMVLLMPKVKGRADGSLVNSLVREQLSL